MERSNYGSVHAININHGKLRLCNVKMEWIKNRSGRNTGREIEERKALFHGWSSIANLLDASPMIGGHPGGTIADTLAIVEYADGKIERVFPEQIRFLDTSDYWPE